MTARVEQAPAAAPHQRPRRRLLRLAAKVLLAGGLLAVSVLVLVNSSGELLSAADQISGIEPAWLLLAVVAELLSYAAYSLAHLRLLARAGAPHVGLGPMTTTAVVAQATANCVPGGVAVTTVVTWRQLTRRGVGPAATGWALALGSGSYLTALALLSLVAAQIAGPTGPVPELRVVSAGLVAVLLLAAGGAVLLRDRVDLPALETRLRRRLHREAGPTWAAQLRTFRLGRRALVTVLALMLLSWLADVGVLVTAFAALDSPVPWRGLLLAYCAGQVAAAIPITPGGLGVVEGSLTLALVAFGGSAGTTLAAVLLYRLVSFWGLLPAGAGGWLLLRRWGRRLPEPGGAPA